MLTLPDRRSSSSSSVVIRKPLTTKNMSTTAANDANATNAPWTSSTIITPSPRMPSSGGE